MSNILFNFFVITFEIFSNNCYANKCWFCEKDSDCKNCLFGEYCRDSCSTFCKSAKEGDSCSSDSDCNPSCALQVKLYCVDNKCSFNCKSVREGDSCDYESDCNPMCDIYSFSSKKYGVDKKCSIFETNPFE